MNILRSITHTLLLALCIVGLPPKNYAAPNLDGDPPGKISFSATNDKLTAEGTFDQWEITHFDMPDGNVEKIKLVIEVDLNSVNTGMEGLDKHLRENDFFDAAQHPKATITIKGANKTRNGYATTMTVDLKGKTSKLISTFDVVSEKPFKVKGTANYDRSKNDIGDPGEGAYGNLLKIVKISYEATMPQKEAVTTVSADAPPGKISYTSTNDKRTATGVFEKWAFTHFEMPKGDIANVKATIEVDLASVNSGLPKLDNHLRADDFFDTAQFPKAIIHVNGAQKNRGGGYIANMEVEMKGVKSQLMSTFEIVSDAPLTIKGKANFKRAENNIGEPGEGAYYNLEPMVTINFEATLPEKDNISFTAINDKLTANGHFLNWDIKSFDLNGGMEKMKAVIEVDLTSVKTGMDKLDAHLNAPDFFDTAKHPVATITLDGAKKNRVGGYMADLNLNMKGVDSKLPCIFQVISVDPLRVKGKANFKRVNNNIGEPKKGAYKNLLPEVEIAFMATMPKTPPGKIKFSATNDKLTAEGTFKKWEVTHFELTDGTVETIKANIEVDLKSVRTGMDGLDAHLNAVDFFDTANHPKAKIQIKGAKRTRGRLYATTMTVEMKGKVSKLPCTFEVISEKPLQVKGKATYKRIDNEIGDSKQGAYYNLLPKVEIEFEAKLEK